MNSEQGRIQFLIDRDGKASAIDTIKLYIQWYRMAVLKNGKDGSNRHFASTRKYRRRFINSYVEFKRFVSAESDDE